MLFWRRKSAKSDVSAVKHPVKSDFHTTVTRAGMNLTFKPTSSVYIFDRRAGNASFVGIQHAGRNTGDYPSDEVQDMARQIALEYPAFHFSEFPDEAEANRLLRGT